MKLTNAALITAIVIAVSCNGIDNHRQMKKAASAFAEDFFSCKFKNAMSHCTPESQRWIVYAASNVTEEDIKAINSSHDKPVCKTTDILTLNDSTAVATVKVNDFILMDSIGITGRKTQEAFFTINMKLRDGSWKIHLTSLPQMKRDIH